jgi:predicted nucleic acid-binding protein
MNSTTEVCVDASLAVKVVVAEADSDTAHALFDRWADDGNQLIAPIFFGVEIDSILRQKVVLRRELTPDQADGAFAKLQALPIRQISLSGQRQRAWEIATQFGFANTMRAIWHWRSSVDVSFGRRTSDS